MRNSRAIDALLPRSVQDILGAVLIHRSQPWYLSDLAQHLGRAPSSLQRPLAALVRGGILSRRREGNRVYFQVDPACPLLPELRGLLAKTVGLVHVLEKALRPLADRITVAFVYGSVARGGEGSASDIDLMLVGAAGLADLSPHLRAAEDRLARPVNATVYTRAEFAAKIASRNHFVTAVLGQPKLFVLGTEHELEEASRRRAR